MEQGAQIFLKAVWADTGVGQLEPARSSVPLRHLRRTSGASGTRAADE